MLSFINNYVLIENNIYIVYVNFYLNKLYFLLGYSISNMIDSL